MGDGVIQPKVAPKDDVELAPMNNVSSSESLAQTSSPFLSETPSSLPVQNAPRIVKKELFEPKTIERPPLPKNLPPTAAWSPPVAPGLEPLHLEDEEEVYGMTRKKWLFAGGGILLLALILGGVAWYFMRSTSVITEGAPSVPVTPVTLPVEAPVILEPPFSVEKANYLSVDTETMTAESLSVLLKQSADRMTAAKMTLPVEFLVTDKNNNPIAFSRFAYLLKLEIPKDLLATIGESFSLFLFNGGERVSLGLSLRFNDETVGRDLINKKESSLPLFFRTLLFNGATLPKQIIFRSSTYNSVPVRFVNVDSARALSLDYALREKEWLLGGSKETLRAMIDKKR